VLKGTKAQERSRPLYQRSARVDWVILWRNAKLDERMTLAAER
jgi:hypothetical protein